MSTEEKKILITGGTGFVGSFLSEELMREGNYITIVTRDPSRYRETEAANQMYIGWDEVESVMDKMDVVINLAGENLFGQRWTDSVKKKIYNSRIDATRTLVDAMRASATKPELLISVSGVGIYGDSGDTLLTEDSPHGNDFLAEVCTDWEKEAMVATDLGVRVAIPRLGIVLEKNGGMLEKMYLPFSLFVGGPIGSGEQYIPWIHMNDLCRALMHPMHNTEFSGVYNACSPEPATMSEFANVLGEVMNRPSLFRVPEFALKLVLGEAATPAISSLNVQPKVLQVSGFEFEFEDLRLALADIV
jgi:uncharacterized protein